MGEDLASNSVSTSPLRGRSARVARREGGIRIAADVQAATPLPNPPPQGGGNRPRVRRGLRLSLAAILLLLRCDAGAAFAWWIASLGPAPLGEDLGYSTLVVDRDGRLLRPTPRRKAAGGCRRRVDSVDPRFIDMLLAYEDKRFRSHHGVDPLALARAA